MLKGMLQACTMEFKGNWDDYMNLAEFVIIIIIIMQALEWHPLKHCTVEIAGHQYVGWRSEKSN